MRERFLRNRRLIINYYLGAGIALFLFWWFARIEAEVDPVILSILALYLLLFPVVILYTRKYALQIFLFLLALITGFYSFYHYSLDEHSVLNALYFTFQLYVLIVTDVFTPDGSSLLQYPLIVEVARWSAALYTISTIFIAMYRMVENSVLVLVYHLIGNHTIVFGYNDNSLAFIKDLRKKKRRVIFVADRLPHEAVNYLEALKVAIVHHHENQDNLYTKCGVGRAENIVFLHQEDVDNLNEFIDFRGDFVQQRRNNPDLTVYIHLQESMSRALFLELDETMRGIEQYFNVQLINIYESFANKLFEKQSIFNNGQVEQPVHLLIIGFGMIGQHIAIQAIREHTLIKKNTLQITVLDKSISQIEQEWINNYGDLQKSTSITFRSFDVTKDALNTVIREEEQQVTQIYVCMHDDELDLWAGIELSNKFPQIPIFLEYSVGSFAEKWLQTEVSGKRLIYSLGTLRAVLTEELLHRSKKE